MKTHVFNTMIAASFSLFLLTMIINSAPAAMIDGSGITVTASNTNGNAAYDNSYVTDGSGITANYGDTGTEWFTDAGEVRNDTWISFDLGAEYVLDSIHIWNANRYNDWGIDQLDVYVSTVVTPGDPEGAGAGDWTQIGVNVNFAQAPYRAADLGFDFEPQTGITLPGTAVRHVRFEVDTAFDAAATGFVGLNEAQFFEAQIPEPASLALIGLGGLLTAGRRRRR